MLSGAVLAQNWDARNGPGLVYRASAAASPGGGVVQYGGSTDPSVSPIFFPSSAVVWTWRYDVGSWQHLQTAVSPPAVFQPMMCYDSVRDRAVLFGGLEPFFPQVPPTTWEWDGSAWSQVVTTNLPSAVGVAGFAFDPLRGVVVLHGGSPWVGQPLSETWEYDGQQWQLIQTPTTVPPTGFDLQAMAWCANTGDLVRVVDGPQGLETWHYDGVDWTLNAAATGTLPEVAWMVAAPSGGVMTVVQDYQADSRWETWRYDGVVWQQVGTTTVPTTNRRTWLVHEPSRNVVLLGERDVVWRFDGTDWALEAPSRMLRTTAAAVAFDTRRGRLVKFGGTKEQPNGGVAATDEHWEWDGRQWLQRTFPLQPSPRQGIVACYDRARETMVVTEIEGGTGPSGADNEVWEFDGQAWTFAGITPPEATEIVAWAYDARRRACVALTWRFVFPGYGHELWTYDGTTWTQLPTPTNPPYRQDPVFAYDAARDRLVLFGGGFSATFYADTWEYDGTDWQQMQPQVRPTAGRATGGYDPSRGRVTVLSHADGRMWEFDGTNWQPNASAGPPPSAHSDRLVIDDRNGETLALGWFGEVAAWRPDPVPHWAPSGYGCAHPASPSGAAPCLTAAAASVPALGATFDLEVQGLHDPSAPVVLLLGLRTHQLAGQLLPLELSALGLPGCQLWLAPSVLEAAFGLAGTASFSLPLPANTALAGAHLWSQAIEVDPTSPFAIGAVSNAGVATLY